MTKEDLQQIAELFDNKFDEKLKPISNRLDKIEERLDKIENDIEIIKEDARETRYTTNAVSEWVEIQARCAGENYPYKNVIPKIEDDAI